MKKNNIHNLISYPFNSRNHHNTSQPHYCLKQKLSDVHRHLLYFICFFYYMLDDDEEEQECAERENLLIFTYKHLRRQHTHSRKRCVHKKVKMLETQEEEVVIKNDCCLPVNVILSTLLSHASAATIVKPRKKCQLIVIVPRFF